MKIHLEPFSAEVGESVIDIFNDYVENSFAAYPEERVSYEFFDMFLKMSAGYPTVVAKDENEVVGFGMLRPHSPIPTFSHTTEISYFVKPGYTNRGIGSLMLEHLIGGAKEKGLSSILANISSLNQVSINFHRKHGFVECGRFRGVGRKHGRVFDIVWMQKKL